MVDYLSTEEKRHMVRNALQQLSQEKFSLEISLVANMHKSPKDLQPHKDKLSDLRRSLVNLETQYVELLVPVEETSKGEETSKEKEPNTLEKFDGSAEEIVSKNGFRTPTLVPSLMDE